MTNEEKNKQIILLFTLFEITQTYLYVIKDTVFRQRAKQFFNSWIANGRRLANLLNINIKKTDDPTRHENRFEDGQEYVLTGLEILWSIPEGKRGEFIERMKAISTEAIHD
jgi:hypothetical protein